MTHTSKKGFTLAEVLTTLMVIGVVAAMTIPTLMNSTKDQQDKVAYKKAMSVLGQGAQLMIAKEIECKVTNSDELAACFNKNALAGTQGLKTVDDEDAEHTNSNVVVTPDGMAFGFYYNGLEGKNGTRSLSDICGERFTGGMNATAAGTNTFDRTAAGRAAANPQNWSGSDAACLVVVDTNGLVKGSKYFASDWTGNNTADITYEIGSDKFAFILTGTGVSPIFDEDSPEGFEWIYGKDATPIAGTNN